MHAASCIRKYTGTLMMVFSFVLPTSAYGQAAPGAGKNCPEAAAAPSPDCTRLSRVEATSLSAGKNNDPIASEGALPNDRQSISVGDEDKSKAPNLLSKDSPLSSNEPSPCTTATPTACPPPPSGSVNKLDKDLPNPTPGANRDMSLRPSTANNSYKSDQTKDERSRTLMGH